jgi:gliding motility-associated-like protein
MDLFRKKFLLLILIASAFFGRAMAQCVTTPINAYPFTQDFESGPGGWTSGGIASDWIWESPQRSVISSAGQGTKSWFIGGSPTGSSYTGAQNSWLQSPCFDFTTLTNPQVSFMVFWETERQYDGATFQYSLDGGLSFTTLGSETSNSSCLSENWFNYAPINFLGGEPGWSGNIQSTSGSCLGGNGSNGWKSANHSLATLAGEPDVIFRFRFASGNICNDFNGFAMDYFQISETPPANAVDFTRQCINSNTVAFSVSSPTCNVNIAWDFDDPASGNNSSTQESVTHVFSGPGTYTVSLSITFNAVTVTHTEDVHILSANVSVITPIRCFGDNNGSVRADVTGGIGGYTYVWNTFPVEFVPVLTGLSPGNYTVKVNAADACEVEASVDLVQPDNIEIGINAINERCSNQMGSITSTVQGGIQPYDYLWSTGAVTSGLTNLVAGTYSLTVTDNNGCIKTTDPVAVQNILVDAAPYLGEDKIICPGNILVLSPGAFANYLWHDGSSTPTYNASSTGKYYVSVTDSDGCTGEDTITVTVDCSDVYFPAAFTPNGDGINETFGALGNLAAVRNFSLSVYNRYGQLVFHSMDPFKKWDGKFKGLISDTQVFTWHADFLLNGKRKGVIKGTILLLH